MTAQATSQTIFSTASVLRRGSFLNLVIYQLLKVNSTIIQILHYLGMGWDWDWDGVGMGWGFGWGLDLDGDGEEMRMGWGWDGDVLIQK